MKSELGSVRWWNMLEAKTLTALTLRYSRGSMITNSFPNAASLQIVSLDTRTSDTTCSVLSFDSAVTL